MAKKRFIDCDIWKKKWFREFPPKMKLFYFYVLTQCDHAGMYDVDLELAEFQIGMPIDAADINKLLKDHIEIIKDDKWFLRKFVDFQYGQLRDTNNAHISVIKILNKYGVNLGANEVLTSSSQADQDKEQDKEQDKSKVKEKEKMNPDILKVSKAHKKTIGYRRTMFLRSVSEFAETYPKEMRIEFSDYWTEAGGNKMRWEKEKVFDVGRRLSRWAKNDFSGKNVSKSFKLDATGNAYVAYCGACGTSDFYDKNGINGDSICCKKELLPEHPKKRMLN